VQGGCKKLNKILLLNVWSIQSLLSVLD
jgi:hypothetical protein